MKISKEDFDKLYSDTVTKKEYDQIITKIEARFNEIMETIWPSAKRPYKAWYDWGNCEYEGENSNGYFDPKDYKENIEIGGECVNLPEPYSNCGSPYFPTRWLWEDFEDEFKAEVAKEKAKEEAAKAAAKQAAENSKAKKQQLMDSIKSKLTTEEFKYVLSFLNKGKR